jgi:hypothetical protein
LTAGYSEKDYLDGLLKLYQARIIDRKELQKMVDKCLDLVKPIEIDSPPTEFNEALVPGSILADMFFLRDKLRKAKPNDRSDTDRHFAIAITELEKLMAYFSIFIVPD